MRVVLLALVCLIGCVRTHYVEHLPVIGRCSIVDVQVDVGFSNEDQRRIDMAIEEWNKSLNGYMRYEVVSRVFDMKPDQLRAGGIIIMKVSSDNTIVPTANGISGNVLGWTDTLGGRLIWIVRDRLWEGQVEGVVMHELGHVLGVGHLGSKSLMYKMDGGTSTCVDKETAMEVARIHGWDIDHLVWCQ
jgi:hypothetical protein